MAIGSSTFSDAAGAVSDLFGAFGDSSKAQGLRLKAQGDLLESKSYDEASTLALQNEQFTQQSTAIKEFQQQRQTTMQLGQTSADVAGAGLAASGSALDVLADSASQGALAKAVLGQQGLITEAGYQEQAQSYQNMSAAAKLAAKADEDAASAADNAGIGSAITGVIKGAAAIATL